ncbi:S1 RNA-binding domain-containing protein [Chakrabartyella piscis]|uniref:S1 RNA-binding domain-containing protein n=1 Tax=Chakrabartyella piscis TaxID=2918914 RepID=UPI002958815E|nr:S1 RNA-binding domain-containing protein [Chakrabartyella piscis]
MSDKLEVGSIVEGKIVRIKPFGAIVSLGNAQGLVHISQVANSFVQDINDHIKIGDVVKVKVLSIDEETHKIALSIRDALPKEERPQKSEKPFRKPNPQGQRSNSDYSRAPSYSTSPKPPMDFEDKMKEWAKQSNERQTTLNKRANKRSY